MITFTPQLKAAIKAVLLEADRIGDSADIPGEPFTLIRINKEQYKKILEAESPLIFPLEWTDEFALCVKMR